MVQYCSTKDHRGIESEVCYLQVLQEVHVTASRSHMKRSSHGVTEQNRGSTACRHKSQTREAGAGAKGKSCIQVLLDLASFCSSL